MSLSNCTELRFVDVGENKLSGRIPAWIGERLSELYVLVLRTNRFVGRIPTQVCWLHNLQLLDLSNNRLSDNIPECVGNLTAMVMKRSGDDMANHRYLSYLLTYNPRRGLEVAVFSDNAMVAWKGQIREFQRSGLGLLKSIDLSNNSFSGIIPNNITSLVGLVSLNLSTNKLHGKLPKDIGRLTSLNSLDLSRNAFSGEIPTSLSPVASLGYLNLSNNNFSGKIPLGSQLQLFDISSYSGNPLLCGLPLPQKCGFETDDTIEGKEEVVEDESEVSKSYYMGMGVGFAAGFWGICGVIFFNRRCRHFLFVSLSRVKDWIYITMVVHLQKFKRSIGSCIGYKNWMD